MTSWLSVFVASVFAALSPADQLALTACGVDAEALDVFMEMDQSSFDQDFTGGWREVYEREGCGVGAAVLVETYILFSQPFPPETHGILRWHAGQILANEGETARALAFFQGTYLPEDDGSKSDWDLYVDATIAFLDNDQVALENARDVLAARTPDEETMALRQQFLDDNPTITMPDGFVTESQNLPVVDGLVACFGRPYSEAYGDCTHKR